MSYFIYLTDFIYPIVTKIIYMKSFNFGSLCVSIATYKYLGNNVFDFNPAWRTLNEIVKKQLGSPL